MRSGLARPVSLVLSKWVAVAARLAEGPVRTFADLSLIRSGKDQAGAHGLHPCGETSQRASPPTPHMCKIAKCKIAKKDFFESQGSDAAPQFSLKLQSFRSYGESGFFPADGPRRRLPATAPRHAWRGRRNTPFPPRPPPASDQCRALPRCGTPSPPPRTPLSHLPHPTHPPLPFQPQHPPSSR